MEGGNGEERGGPGHSVGQRSGAASACSGLAAVHTGGAAWYVSRPTEQGRGGGTDRWATTTVPGGGTG
jgi:hypothetical protein